MKMRGVAVALAITIAASCFPATPWGERVAGLSLDAALAIRHDVFGPSRTAQEANVVVIAIDEETHRTPPFGGLPQALWTNEIAPVLKAVLDAQSKIVAFDVIFPTSIEKLAPGYEREFLRALRSGARDGRILLGKVQHQSQPIAPFPGQSFAVGHDENIRAVNLIADADGVIRRAPLFFQARTGDDSMRKETGFALEIASRFLGVRPEEADGAVWLAGARLASARSNAFAIDFVGGGKETPTYSLADLRACVEKGDVSFFERNFAGKAVLVGVVLDVEDRKLTSKRFMTGAEGAGAAPRCALDTRRDLVKTDLVREEMPGVYIHAAAIENLLRGEGLREVGGAGRVLASSPGVAMAVGAVLSLPVVGVGVALLALATSWTALAVVLLETGIEIPWLDGLVAAAFAATLAMGWRFAVVDKDKRFLRRSFSLYLAPAVIDKLVAGATPPQLGGEEREVTVMFSDVAGFTSLSEGLSPNELVGIMNVYLTAMTEIIEAEGGFVDKYVGDAIVAVFGAPAEDPYHARNAVAAALACQAKLDALNADPAQPFRGNNLSARIGLNTGRALVGNIGSARRFNYTVMGDAVNLASRLEGACKYFGCSIMVSDATRSAAGDEDCVWRELDRIRVKGRSEPVGVHEPLPANAASVSAPYAAALALYRQRDFHGAAKVLDAWTTRDGPSATLSVRIERAASTPLAPNWDAVMDLEAK